MNSEQLTVNSEAEYGVSCEV